MPRLVLGIDTASPYGSIALGEEGRAVAWEILRPGEHSSGLSLAAGRLLESRGAGLRDLAGIAVSSGPGSFTGLRIGLAWAKGVCFGSSAKLTLVSAHEANAYRERSTPGLIAVVLPGERGEAQCSLWSGGERPILLWGPERVPEGDLPHALREAAETATSTLHGGGSGSSGVTIVGPDLEPPSAAPGAAAVAEIGHRNLLSGQVEDIARAAPAYGRAPNARKPAT